MKKRIVATMLILSMALSGCGSSGSADTATTSTQKVEDTSSTEDAFSELDALGDVEVDKNIFDVTITVPADYVGDVTQEELDAQAKESDIHSITLNEDGSATYVMSKSQHKQMMKDLADNCNASLSDMVGSMITQISQILKPIRILQSSQSLLPPQILILQNQCPLLSFTCMVVCMLFSMDLMLTISMLISSMQIPEKSLAPQIHLIWRLAIPKISK